MTPTNYIRLWIRAYRRRKIRKVLSKELKSFFYFIYNGQIKDFNVRDYIIWKLMPQSKPISLSYIIVIFLKIITLYIFVLILYDLWKFIYHVIFLFRKFLYKQKLLYWYINLLDFERLLYKFKKIPRVYIKDTITKHTIIRDHLLFVNKYMKTYNSVNCLVKQSPEFYETRKIDWELFHEKAKSQFRDWRKTAMYYLIELNYIRYANMWTFKYLPKFRRYKFNLLFPYRRIFYKYALKIIRIIYLNAFKIGFELYRITGFLKSFFIGDTRFKNFLMQRFASKNSYLNRKYGIRYIYFLLDYKNKIENVDEHIVEKEIKSDSLVYGRVLNEQKYFESLKGYGNIFWSIRFYLYKISHKVYFDRNHYIMYLNELELILKRKHFPEENFNITFKLKSWRIFKPFLLISIRIFPYIAKPLFILKKIIMYLIHFIKIVLNVINALYLRPIINTVFDKVGKFFDIVIAIIVYTIPGIIKKVYTFLKTKPREICRFIWIILKGK